MVLGKGVIDTRKGEVALFDAVQFVIDEISIDSVVGHYVLMKEGLDAHVLPVVKLKRGHGALLDGIKIRTRFKINIDIGKCPKTEDKSEPDKPEIQDAGENEGG